MVVYDLACPLEHRFEGWFESAASFEAQREGGHVSCPLCNSKEITRLPSAPYLRGAAQPAAEESGGQPMMMVAGNLVATLRRQVVQQVLAMTEDVGEDFPDVVRDMHYGEAETRNVRGVASPEALEELHEEGIDVMVLGIPDKLGSTH
ncbi:MAG: DUF1178 family protein [Betaproteobacteria bacterium]|nr:DUF1178 family protein [Betaproteobacteria bacterium]